MERTYWLDLFTYKTLMEFSEAKGKVSGFRQSKWTTVSKIKKGDRLVCYLTGISRFVGILEVVSDPYKSDNPKIWSDEDFPCRVNVKAIAMLTPATAIPVHELKESLSFRKDFDSPAVWTGHFRSSPRKYKVEDGLAIEKAIMKAVKQPIERPYDERKLKYRPIAIRAKLGAVTVPVDDETLGVNEDAGGQVTGNNLHTEIQWHLLKLGNDMGFDVWAARNDKGKVFNGNSFSELTHFKKTLPLQFDEATNKTIELIDVLWLKGNAIVGAFEIESTTSIYSGLLRMSDLITMQPNANIPLFLLAPQERKEKVFIEVNRPTFAKLQPPLSTICRFISFESLIEQIERISSIISLTFIKPEFLQEISESCEIEEL